MSEQLDVIRDSLKQKIRQKSNETKEHINERINHVREEGRNDLKHTGEHLERLISKRSNQILIAIVGAAVVLAVLSGTGVIGG